MIPDAKTEARGVVLSPAPLGACLLFMAIAKCTGLEKSPCRLSSPQVHLAGARSLLKRLESFGDAAPDWVL